MSGGERIVIQVSAPMGTAREIADAVRKAMDDLKGET